MTANPLDLVSLQRVKNWLGLTATVNTTVAGAIAQGLQVVTPTSMAGIVPNVLLAIDTDPNQEIVTVINITATTFSAIFSIAHDPGAVVLLGADAILPQLITSAGMTWLTETGRIPSDGTVPTVSPLVQLCSFNEIYDGNGSPRLYVRNPPIASITSVKVNGQALSASLGFPAYGYVIGEYGSSIVLVGNSFNFAGFGGLGFGAAGFLGSAGGFGRGIQNVNAQYMGGYASTPLDIVQACTEMVGLTFKKRQWIGQRSQALAAGGGTTTYTDWEISKLTRSVMQNYRRVAYV